MKKETDDSVEKEVIEEAPKVEASDEIIEDPSKNTENDTSSDNNIQNNVTEDSKEDIIEETESSEDSTDKPLQDASNEKIENVA